MVRRATAGAADDGWAARWGVPATAGFPPCPPPELDPFLDAARDCFLRYGIRRTSVQDVAAVMRVNRTTVYRQVGNVDSMVRLLTARELHRHLGEALHRTDVTDLTPQSLVRLLAEMIRIVRGHPIVAKILTDERELVGSLAQTSTGLFSRMARTIAPGIGAAIATGQLADRDPAVVAEWVARISVTALLSPPPGDLEAFLGEMLVPALEPAGTPATARRSGRRRRPA